MASAGAAAALIGLLFVAISVRPERVFGEAAEAQNSLVASASFMALLNAFFISLGALIPGVNLSTFILIISPVSILNSAALAVDAFRQTSRAAAMRALGFVVVALVLYGYELTNALRLLQAPGNDIPVYNTAGALLGIYVYGVARAWQLLGANRRSVLSLLVPWLRHQPKPKNRTETSSAGSEPPVQVGMTPKSATEKKDVTP